MVVIIYVHTRVYFTGNLNDQLSSFSRIPVVNGEDYAVLGLGVVEVADADADTVVADVAVAAVEVLDEFHTVVFFDISLH